MGYRGGYRAAFLAISAFCIGSRIVCLDYVHSDNEHVGLLMTMQSTISTFGSLSAI